MEHARAGPQEEVRHVRAPPSPPLAARRRLTATSSYSPVSDGALYPYAVAFRVRNRFHFFLKRWGLAGHGNVEW